MASLGRMDLVATYTYLNPKITRARPPTRASGWPASHGVCGRATTATVSTAGNNRVAGVTLYDAVLANDRGRSAWR